MTTATDTTELFEAARAGDLPTVDRLLSQHPALASARDADGLSLVLDACYRGRQDILQRILAAGPTLDVFDASTVGDVPRLQELIDHDRAVIEAWSVDGYQPLMLASYFGREAAARLLLDRGAAVANASRNSMAVMPLHSAASGGRAGVARLLIERGADVDARSHGGFAPLHSAAQNGHVALVDVLLAAGADPAAATDGGRAPADLAESAGHTELATRLRAAGRSS